MPDTPFLPPTAVRRAQATQAAQACEVVRQSITHCCALDHRHDPAVLAAWLANKTADHLAAWMAAPHAMAWGAYWGVGLGADRGADRGAEAGSTMVGFALLTQDKLALCYVVPQALHQGVGRALLLAAEAGARQAGIAALVLESTRTAEAFYRCHGYEPAGAVQAWAGLQAQPMCKRL
ncbi:GNAT family N-acetyltransferase [Acidovorax sp. 1608163]|uniref:GNAT family N-acetyltransferase n=1 Tax=Acidovorax sp. 1608163 TaxID=2478662 RepID=UPI000EF71C06|nr:GNAT family N-acetyltransferase [Acidovorax sp. 1608163]AYM98544.1 GNAT family N-acetyltransferase [Acidovorax sp. 1608163]